MRQSLRLPLLSLVNGLLDKRVVGIGALLADSHFTREYGPSESMSLAGRRESSFPCDNSSVCLATFYLQIETLSTLLALSTFKRLFVFYLFYQAAFY
jgi:hypothetical protein